MDSSLTRREFIGKTTSGAAALALMKPEFAQAQAPSGMYIALPPWAVARGVNYPDSARLASKLGYGGLDNWAIGPAKQAGIEATRALFAELKVKPNILNLPGARPWDGDDAAFQARLPQIEEDAAFCSAVGCQNFMAVLQASSQQAKEERWKLVTTRLGVVSKILEKHKMRLGLEFLGPLHFRTGAGGRGGGRGRGGAAAGAPAAGTAAPGATAPATPAAPPAAPAAPVTPPPPPTVFVYTLKETVQLATESGPAIGVVLDFWHWYHSGGTIADILATDPKRITNVHISDAKEMPAAEVHDSMRWLPGEGVIDLVGGLQALKKIGWQGGVCPETIGPRIPADMAPEESARLALEATAAVMKKAGVL